MSGSAVLTAGPEETEVEITWVRGPEQDARARVPKAWLDPWRVAVEILKRAEVVRPYANLPLVVPAKKLLTSASGIFAVAREVWGARVAWKTPPPGFEPSEIPEGAVP